MTYEYISLREEKSSVLLKLGGRLFSHLISNLGAAKGIMKWDWAS